jgi:hypothetical protein
MAIDILVWIEGITKIAPALAKVLDTIKESKFLISGKKLKHLKKDLEEILKEMGYVGKIGGLLNEYIQYYVGSYAIYTTSDKLTETVNRYYMDLSDEGSQYHKTSWEVVEGQFKSIKEHKITYLNVILRRINYLDVKDAEQINMYVIEFNKKYEQANTYLRERNAENFKTSIEDMSEQALSLYGIFDDSISNMVNNLIRIKGG